MVCSGRAGVLEADSRAALARPVADVGFWCGAGAMFRWGEQPCRIAWRAGVLLATGAVFVIAVPDGALADDINYALIQSYQNNPQLNAQRAAARAIDEGVSTALAGYRP